MIELPVGGHRDIWIQVTHVKRIPATEISFLTICISVLAIASSTIWIRRETIHSSAIRGNFVMRL